VKRPIPPIIYRLIPWGLPLGLLLIWQLAAQLNTLSARVLPAPSQVIEAGYQLAASGELFHHLAISFRRAIVGFLIGGTIGFALGLANGISWWCETLFDSSMQMFRTIPHLALVPLVILWFGIGEEAKLFLVATGVMFPIYLNTFHGIRSIDPGLLEMGRLYGLGPWSLFRNIVLPGAMPSILVGFRYGLGIMWLTLIVAETISANAGIGYMAMNAREFLRTDVVVLSILLYALLGKLADSAARALEWYWLDWHPSHLKKN
jgi:sulfonate transport system permease protein